MYFARERCRARRAVLQVPAEEVTDLPPSALGVKPGHETNLAEDERIVYCVLDLSLGPPVLKLGVDRLGKKRALETSSCHLRLDRRVDPIGLACS